MVILANLIIVITIFSLALYLPLRILIKRNIKGNSPEFLKRIYFKSKIVNAILRHSVLRLKRTNELVGLVYIEIDNYDSPFYTTSHLSTDNYECINGNYSYYSSPYAFLEVTDFYDGTHSTGEYKQYNRLMKIKEEIKKIRVYEDLHNEHKKQNERMAKEFSKINGQDILKHFIENNPEHLI